jgi:hypothetical protein
MHESGADIEERNPNKQIQRTASPPLICGVRCMNMKSKQQKPQFPAATMAFYGPDDKRASKMVVAILRNADAELGPFRKWMSGTTDVRADERIGKEVEAFLKEHHVKQVVTTDRIIGCPHEEGEDYPEGMNCPHCSFWTNRDRFTHEPENGISEQRD